MEITKKDREFFEYAVDFVGEEQDSRFSKILGSEAHRLFLDTYVEKVLNRIDSYFEGGLSKFPVFERFIELELKEALRVGYCVKEAYNRFNLEQICKEEL